MFCIVCGALAEGTSTLRCTACGGTNYLHSKISASALTVVGDRYLVVERGAEPELGKWDLPGGFCELGEDPAAAARRETFEESGIEIAVGRLLGAWMDTYVETDGQPWPTVNLVYSARPTDPAAVGLVDGEEITGLRWAPLASLPIDEVAFPKQQLGAIEVYRELGGSCPVHEPLRRSTGQMTPLASSSS